MIVGCMPMVIVAFRRLVVTFPVIFAVFFVRVVLVIMIVMSAVRFVFVRNGRLSKGVSDFRRLIGVQGVKPFKRNEDHPVDRGPGRLKNARHDKWRLVVDVESDLSGSMRIHNFGSGAIPESLRNFGPDDRTVRFLEHIAALKGQFLSAAVAETLDRGGAGS